MIWYDVWETPRFAEEAIQLRTGFGPVPAGSSRLLHFSCSTEREVEVSLLQNCRSNAASINKRAFCIVVEISILTC